MGSNIFFSFINNAKIFFNKTTDILLCCEVRVKIHYLPVYPIEPLPVNNRYLYMGWAAEVYVRIVSPLIHNFFWYERLRKKWSPAPPYRGVCSTLLTGWVLNFIGSL